MRAKHDEPRAREHRIVLLHPTDRVILVDVAATTTAIIIIVYHRRSRRYYYHHHHRQHFTFHEKMTHNELINVNRENVNPSIW